MRHLATILLLVPFSTLMIGCASNAPKAGTPTPGTAPPPPAGLAPPEASSTPPAMAPAMPEPRDDVIGVSFKGINADGYPEVEITNLTDEGLETFRGSFQATDASGKVVWGTGWTMMVPGEQFLGPGETKVTVPYGLKGKDDMMAILRSDPDSLTFSYQAREFTFIE